MSDASHKSVATRALQQEAAQAEVTVVTTPQQLLDAWDGHAMHIEIRAHLDLTTVEPHASWLMLTQFTEDSDFSRSIRMRRSHFVHDAMVYIDNQVELLSRTITASVLPLSYHRTTWSCYAYSTQPAQTCFLAKSSQWVLVSFWHELRIVTDTNQSGGYVLTFSIPV